MIQPDPIPVVWARTHPDPKVSVIIPSLDGSRGGNVPYLVRQLEASGFREMEILIVRGIRPNGRARDEGVRQAKGRYYVFMDDDVRLGSANLLASLIEPLETYPDSIGMTGAAYLLPPDASDFQKRVARELPRIVCPVPPVLTESDLVCHACLAVPAKVYEETGGEPRDLESGTDPDFKFRVRQKGYKIVLTPNAFVYMPTFENFRGLCRKAYQGGRNSVRMQRFHPGRIQDSASRPGTVPAKSFSLLGRFLRRCREAGHGLVRGHWLALAATAGYTAGWIVESLTGPRRPAASSE